MHLENIYPGYRPHFGITNVIQILMKANSGLGDEWRVLIVGNNPIELNHVNERLRDIQQATILTEMAFDIQSGLRRLTRFHPQHILIDDNIGKPTLHAMVETLSRRRTRNVPITVLKNSNYEETICSGVMNYVLKQNLTSNLLYCELLNSTHFQESLPYGHFRKPKGQLARLLSVAAIQI
jgi:hypothetical protein